MSHKGHATMELNTFAAGFILASMYFVLMLLLLPKFS